MWFNILVLFLLLNYYGNPEVDFADEIEVLLELFQHYSYEYDLTCLLWGTWFVLVEFIWWKSQASGFKCMLELRPLERNIKR